MLYKTVLLVDEDKTLLQTCARHLLQRGLQVLTAESDDQALELAALHPPDYVLIELNTGGGAGWDLCRKLRGQTGLDQVPLVITSRAHQREHRLQKAVQDLGATSYLTKPFGPAALAQSIEKLTDIDFDAMQRLAEANRGVSSHPEGVRTLLKEVCSEIPAPSSMNATPVALVLSRLRARKAQGLLYLREGKFRSLLVLRDGVPVYARTSIPALRFSSLMQVDGRLSGAQVEHARNLVRAFGGTRWLEEVFIGLGHLSGDEVREGLQRMIRRLVRRAIEGSAGTADGPSLQSAVRSRFIESDLALPPECIAPTNLDEVLFDGVRRITDLEQLTGYLPPREGVLVRADEGAAPDLALEDLKLSPLEQEFLGILDGQKTFEELCAVGRRTIGNIETLLVAALDAGFLQLHAAHRRPSQDRPKPTGSSAPTDATDAGSLQERPFALVLADLHLALRTGILTLDSGERKKHVYIKDGEVVFARSNQFEDRIGQVLVKADLVREEDVERAASQSGPDKKRRIGGVLMDEGLVTFEQLYWAGLFQVQGIVRSLFSWTEGSWRFEEGPLPSWLRATPPVETAGFLLEQLRQCPLEALDKFAPLAGDTHLGVGTARSNEVPEVPLNDVEQGILAWVDHDVAYGDLVEVGLAPEEEIRRAVHGLLAVGLLSRTTPFNPLEDLATALEDTLPPEGVPSG